MELEIEAYLKELAVKYNPWYQEDEEEDDSQGIETFLGFFDFNKSGTGSRDKDIKYEYSLWIGKYDNYPNMEGVYKELLDIELNPVTHGKLLLDGIYYTVTVIKGTSGQEGNNYQKGLLIEFETNYAMTGATL